MLKVALLIWVRWYVCKKTHNSAPGDNNPIVRMSLVSLLLPNFHSHRPNWRSGFQVRPPSPNCSGRSDPGQRQAATEDSTQPTVALSGLELKQNRVDAVTNRDSKASETLSQSVSLGG